MNIGFAVFVFVLVISMFLSSTIKLAREEHRIVIFRLGRFYTVSGPGVVFVIPLIDRGIKIDLNELPYNWENLSKEKLEEQIKKNLNLV